MVPNLICSVWQNGTQCFLFQSRLIRYFDVYQWSTYGFLQLIGVWQSSKEVVAEGTTPLLGSLPRPGYWDSVIISHSEFQNQGCRFSFFHVVKTARSGRAPCNAVTHGSRSKNIPTESHIVWLFRWAAAIAGNRNCNHPKQSGFKGEVEYRRGVVISIFELN